jgi:hypothetical protein
MSQYMFIYVSMFQSNVKGLQNTERRVCTEGVHLGCSLSVHVCYSSHPIYTLKSLMFMCLHACSVVPFRSWAAVKQAFSPTLFCKVFTLYVYILQPVEPVIPWGISHSPHLSPSNHTRCWVQHRYHKSDLWEEGEEGVWAREMKPVQ